VPLCREAEKTDARSRRFFADTLLHARLIFAARKRSAATRRSLPRYFVFFFFFFFDMLITRRERRHAAMPPSATAFGLIDGCLRHEIADFFHLCDISPTVFAALFFDAATLLFDIFFEKDGFLHWSCRVFLSFSPFNIASCF